MTVNRLTDEKLREIDRLDINPYVRRMAQELLTLRKELLAARAKIKAAENFVDYVSNNITDQDFHLETQVIAFVASWLRKDVKYRQAGELEGLDD